MLVLPDVLVLGSGGVLGEAWMNGVLSGIEQGSGLDFRRCETLLGTSAGSIVAVSLLAGRRPRLPEGTRRRSRRPAARPRPGWGRRAPTPPTAAGLRAATEGAGEIGRAIARRGIPAALLATEPAGAVARAAMLAAMSGRRRDLDGLRERVQRAGLRFDGRLRIVCVERRRGRRVVFGAPGAPRASVADAVQASCAVPWLFPAVRIGGREYVDGGIWSATNLDVAPAARDTEVLCLNPVGGSAPVLASPLGALRAFSRAALAAEALALRAQGAHVLTVGPDRAAAAAMGANLMDSSRAEAVLAAGHAHGLRIAQR